MDWGLGTISLMGLRGNLLKTTRNRTYIHTHYKYTRTPPNATKARLIMIIIVKKPANSSS